MTQLLTPSESQLLQMTLAPLVIREKGICKLYKTEGLRWDEFSTGIIVLTYEQSSKGYFLIHLELPNFSIVYQQELYQHFSYQSLSSFFHSFEGEEGIVGLSFADDSEAQRFSSTINDVSSSIDKEFTLLATKKKAQQFATTFVSSMSSVGGWLKDSASYYLPTSSSSSSSAGFEISSPKTFTHVSHIGFGENGFEAKNIPGEWKKIFHSAGVRKSELKDPETSKFILDTVSDWNQKRVSMRKSQMITQSITASSGGPPPPPPPPPGPAPPPLPSSNSNGNVSGSSLGSSSQNFGLSLAEQLKSAELRHVDEEELKLSELDEKDTSNLVNTLAAALVDRRRHFSVEVEEEEEDDDDDDAWWD